MALDNILELCRIGVMVTEDLKPEELLDILRNEVEKAGSANKFATRHSIPPSYLYYVLRGKMEPGPKILKALGYRREMRYRKARRYER